MDQKVVTVKGFPHGVVCGRCNKPILPGQRYINRDDITGKLSTGPCTERRFDGIFHASC